MPELCVSLLGGVAVLVGEERHPVKGVIPGAIVARLALAEGAVVSTDTLIEELWADPPESAAASLRVAVSKLRSGTLGAVLAGGRGGYRLDVEPDRIDLVRLLRLLEDPHARSRDELEEAEHLWAEDPLHDLADRPFAETLRIRFRELRRAAAEELARLRIESDDHGDAALGLERIAGEFPLHERPVELRALAFARAGRTSDALAEIDAFRRRLDDELGLDLPSSLDELRQSIVRQVAQVVAPRDAATRVVRHGIPIPLTRFVGRERELAAVEDGRAAARLVTLVGPGGVGKTRLAVESARRSTRTTDDEQWMADLASITSPDQVVPAIADLVGATTPAVEAIARVLDGRRALLILDNAEHVLEVVRAAVRALLEQCEGLTVLVTSREALRIPGERLVQVAPMLGGALGDAEQLFLDRAADSRPELDLERRSDAVRRLVTLLDGIPLALELAAAQLDVLELDEVAEAVTAGTATGTTSSRHSSVTEAIRTSVDLVSADERDLLGQLSRFAGTFDTDAVAGICVAEGDVVPLTRRLAQRSLVAVVEHERLGSRFRVLESVKAYARAGLAVSDEEGWDRRHLEWFAAQVDAIEPQLRSHGASKAWAVLDVSTPDLQQALRTAVALGDRGAALRLTGGQAHYWMSRGLLAEGRGAIEAALAVPGDADDRVEGIALSGVALLAYQSGDPAAATAYLQRAMESSTAAGDTSRVAMMLGYFAYAATLFGDKEQGQGLIAQAVATSEHAEPWARAEVLMCQGQALRALGKPAQALDSLAESRRIALEVGYQWIATSATYVAGKVLIDVRRARDAVDTLVPGAASAYLGEDPMGSLALMHAVGGACAFLEQHRVGAMIFGAVDRLGRRYGYNPVQTEGADAQQHRDRIAEGLTPGEFQQAYRAGEQLEFDDLFRLGAGVRRARAVAA